MLQLCVAAELGMSLARLNQEVTPEELLIWDAFFTVRNEEREKEALKRRR
jgi:hypothetical protein